MHNNLKRLFLALVAGLWLAAGTGAVAAPVKLGDMEVFPLIDGVGKRKPDVLVGAADEQIARYFPTGEMDSQYLAFLVRLPGRTLLLDAGWGPAAGRRGTAAGAMMDELRALGVAPADIDAVLLTHLHIDHYGGLTDAEGKAAFPRAELWVPRVERDWWLDDRQDEAVRRALNLYRDRLHLFAFGGEILPGVTAIDASGHTPGHTAFHIRAGAGELLAVGDILHFAAIQMPLPQVAVTYDVDPDKAVAARRNILDRAAAGDIPIAGMHCPAPGLWRVGKSGDGYALSPLE